MSVKLRLQRHGTKKRPFYRVVAADSRCMRDGRFLEIVGTYNPVAQPAQTKFKFDRIDYWVGTGAQMSDTVRNLVKQARKNEETSEKTA